MNAREAEAHLLARCVRIARGEPDAEMDDWEANVVRVAAMLARSRHPEASRRLEDAADGYFERFPKSCRPPEDLIREGWLIGFPRFRALLDDRLAAS